MMDRAVPASGDAVESALRADLARADAVAETVQPILRQLIAADDTSLFSDEIIARMRGLLSDVARGLVEALVGQPVPQDEVDLLARTLMDDAALLAHVHALALEWQLTERLHARFALDPVASPLVRELISSSDVEVQRTVRAFLAEQARWCQAQRRMELPLRDLPDTILVVIFGTLRAMIGEGSALAERAATVETGIRQSREKNAPRMQLAAPVIAVGRALSAAHAGVALFLSALAAAAGLPRDRVVLLTHESQAPSFALALRAAGSELAAINQQFLLFHPEVQVPAGLEQLDPTLAAALLASGEVDMPA